MVEEDILLYFQKILIIYFYLEVLLFDYLLINVKGIYGYNEFLNDNYFYDIEVLRNS